MFLLLRVRSEWLIVIYFILKYHRNGKKQNVRPLNGQQQVYGQDQEGI